LIGASRPARRAASSFFFVGSMCLHVVSWLPNYNWVGKWDKDLIANLQAFLIDTVEYPRLVSSRATTQANESFNHVKAQFLSKSQKYVK
jgi:hypothetical protein